MSKQVTVIVEGREYVVEVGDLTDRPVRATVNQRTYQVQVPDQSAQRSAPAPVPVQPRPAASVSAPAQPTPASAVESTGGAAITAPLPGDIIEVRVKPGDSVEPGDVVCVLEAMKMKNMIRSSRAGKIASVEVNAGQEVDHGAILVTFE